MQYHSCQRCYYGFNWQLSNRELSRTTKLILYKTLILPVLLSTYATTLRTFERKVLRKLFGPVWVGDDFCIRSNNELYELFNDIDVMKHSNIQRLRWLGHVVRNEDATSAKRMTLFAFKVKIKEGLIDCYDQLAWIETKYYSLMKASLIFCTLMVVKWCGYSSIHSLKTKPCFCSKT